MSQSSHATTEPSSESKEEQDSMPKKVPGLVWFVLIAALVLVLIFAIVPSLISAITYVRTFDTTSPSPTATVTAAQVQEVSNMTKQQADQTKSLLDMMTSFATVMAVVLAVFAVVTVGLGAIGYFGNNAFRDLQDRWNRDLGKLQKKIVNEQTDIHKLQTANIQKQDEIDTEQKKLTKLQQDMEQKQNEIDAKQKILDELINDMKSKVGALEKQTTTNANSLIGFGNLLLEQERGTRAVPEIYYFLGRTYSSLADFDNAIQYLSDAVKLNNNFPEAHMELGLAYRRRGNTWYDKAFLENDQWKKKEWLSKAKDDYKQAVQHLTQAITMRPDYEDALAVLGGLYRRLGAYESKNKNIKNAQEYYEKAQEYYEKAVNAKPNLSYALANKASFLWYFGNDEDARNTFTHVKEIVQERIKKSEDLAGIHWDYYDLALSQLVLGETEQAIDTYSKAIEMTKYPIDFDGVLSNLHLLQAAPKPIKDLDKIITMVELKMSKTT